MGHNGIYIYAYKEREEKIGDKLRKKKTTTMSNKDFMKSAIIEYVVMLRE